MDYKLKTPIEFEGETYDIALFYLSSAPVIRGNDYTTAVNLQVTPARKTKEDVIQLHSHAIRMELTSDIRNSPNSEAILIGFGAVSQIIVGLAVQEEIINQPE